MNNENIEQIVKKILSEMGGTSAPSAAASSKAIPEKARVAMLVEKERFELQEYKIPEVGDDDILVKVEGCGVCGTDAHEFKRDPFGLIPVVLGPRRHGRNSQNG